ncbi:hypothetical protein OH76DRAFT_492529 [Lentinus brumalis]|uniref:Uncharacterized protein n=1 Tax=Lentinus brumalis TaxID=2498619 RepID=A0A371DBE1_9APHY|nr:hypothetical protein OH76DRAFT_492529 [Polyporus brumalis]
MACCLGSSCPWLALIAQVKAHVFDLQTVPDPDLPNAFPKAAPAEAALHKVAGILLLPLALYNERWCPYSAGSTTPPELDVCKKESRGQGFRKHSRIDQIAKSLRRYPLRKGIQMPSLSSRQRRRHGSL